MPYPTQQGVLTRRFTRPRYAPMVRAMAPYAPALKRLREEREYREGMIGLERERLGLTRQQIEDQEEATRKANLIGMGQLGLSGYFGMRRLKEAKSPMSDIISSEPARTGPRGDMSPGGRFDVKGLLKETAFPVGVGLAAGALYKTDDPWKRLGIGAGAGLATHMITHPDPYLDAISGLWEGAKDLIGGF